MDMFEPQDHPDDIPYPGRSADALHTTSPAGRWPSRWGCSSIASSTAFDGPFEKIPDLIKMPGRQGYGGRRGTAGYLLSHQVNDAFVGTTRLLAGR